MIDHIAVTLSDEHRANLETLAAFLERHVPPPAFNISSYAETTDQALAPEDVPNHYNECGTTACAVGHGPLAGFEPKKDEWWCTYEKRVFGVGAGISRENYDAWCWMFDPDWADVDNTAKGAASRIRYFLANGVPTNCSSQQGGYDPLCYEVAS